MKRNLYTALVLVASAFLIVKIEAQTTLNIVEDNIVYAIEASQTGDMPYSDGKTLTVGEQVFDLDKVQQVYVNNSPVGKNNVVVRYYGDRVVVRAEMGLRGKLSAQINGCYVALTQSNDVSDEISYIVRGEAQDGSLTLNGSYKTTVVLRDLNIKSGNGQALYINNGKRINLLLEGDNVLEDAANGSHKACLQVKGHTEIDGSGTLTLKGNTKHAFWGKEYLLMKKNAGKLVITKAVEDGINVNQYFQQNGGEIEISGVGDDGLVVSFKTDDNDKVISLTEDADNTGYALLQGGKLTISTTGDGSKGLKSEGEVIINEEKSIPVVNITCSGGALVETVNNVKDTSVCCCLKSEKAITIQSGTITLRSTGDGGRAMLSDNTIDISGGTISARAEGNNYGSSSSSGWGGGGWWAPRKQPMAGPGGGGPGGGGPGGFGGNSSNSKNAKGIKAKGALTISGGEINVYSAHHEALESKSTITISGGQVYAEGSDDAINATSDLTISGGYVYAYAASNDGLDSNGNMYIKGGVAVSFGGSGAETGIDIDESHKLYISGGELFGIGGRLDSKFGTMTQSYGYTSSSATFSGNYIVVYSGSTYLFAVKMPKSSYSGVVLTSSTKMQKGTSYSVGVSSSVTGTEVNGFIADPTVKSATSKTTFTAK